MQPKITVITISMNAVKTIERTIKSVLAQNYDNLEYIIIDGGSCDGTVDIIKKYEELIHVWISEPDAGVYDAMNKGMQKATGEYIHFLNSDDWFAKNALHIAAYYMENVDAEVYYGDIVKIYEKERRTAYPRPLDDINWRMPFCHQGVFVKNRKNRIFDTSYRIAADYKMLLDIYQAGNKFQYMPYKIANFTMGGLSSNQYDCDMEVIRIACEGLIRTKRNIQIYRPLILRTYVEAECRHLYQTGQNHKQIVEYLENILRGKEEIIIYGTGKILNEFWRILQSLSVHIKYFVDGDAEIQGEKKNGVLILAPEALCHEKNVTIVVMSEKYCDEIMEFLDSLQLDPTISILDYKTIKEEFKNQFTKDLIKRGEQEISSLKNMMEL